MSSLCARLPPEIKAIICQLLSSKDLRKARFIDVPWGNVAASILFHTIDSNLAETETLKLKAILTSRAGGILDSIRCLRVGPAKTGEQEKQSQDLLRLASVLHKDSLTQLSFAGCVEKEILGLYLRMQTQLHTLKVFVIIDGQPSLPPSASYVLGSLDKLKSLTIATQNHNAIDFACWAPRMPLLRMLRVTATDPTGAALFKGWTPSERIPTFNLRVLCFIRIRFPDSPDQILDMLHFARLQNLCLAGCQNSAPLMKRLAQESSQVPNKLRIFRHMLEEFEGDLDHIRDLLMSTTKLEEICIDARKAHPLPISCLAHHGCSLRFLRLAFSHISSDYYGRLYDEMYPAVALKQLVKACTSLEFLGLSLSNIDFDTWAPLEPMKLDPISTTREGSQRLTILLIIASLPKLETLCLTHSPYCATGRLSILRERQWRHAQLAGSILSYLDKLGSPVRFLAFRPPSIRGPSGYADSNSHTWPHYYYRKAKIILEEDIGQGLLGTLALPVTEKTFRKLSPWHQRLV